ncbi:translation initiation factor IF-2-like isoform X2 [Pristis pectinata]|uniref:translation initiation factor IF-2-like isoform X2 n=1 Tax=Pristis pectinata TaxID=685728 RepID=UPI00223E2376|nr:translation initiation factor IF-2-like isoform X2 [Pristis pectinata]
MGWGCGRGFCKGAKHPSSQAQCAALPQYRPPPRPVCGAPSVPLPSRVGRSLRADPQLRSSLSSDPPARCAALPQYRFASPGAPSSTDPSPDRARSSLRTASNPDGGAPSAQPQPPPRDSAALPQRCPWESGTGISVLDLQLTSAAPLSCTTSTNLCVLKPTEPLGETIPKTLHPLGRRENQERPGTQESWTILSAFPKQRREKMDRMGP